MTTTVQISSINRNQINGLGRLMRQTMPELWEGSRITADTVIGYALEQAIRGLQEAQEAQGAQAPKERDDHNRATNPDLIGQLGQLMRQDKPSLWASTQITADTIIGYALLRAVRELEEAQALK